MRRKIDRKILIKDDKNKSSKLITKQVISHSLVVGVPLHDEIWGTKLGLATRGGCKIKVQV